LGFVSGEFSQFTYLTIQNTLYYSGDGLLIAGISTTYPTIQLTWGNNANILFDGSDDYIYGPDNMAIEQVNTKLPQSAAISGQSGASDNPTFLYITPVSTISAVDVINTKGYEDNLYAYDPYGNLIAGSQGSIFGYEGQYDPAGAISTGYIYMRARWYDPGTGQFDSLDPEYLQTDAAYSYAGDNPVNEWDPGGKHWCDILPVGCGILPGGPGGPCSSLGQRFDWASGYPVYCPFYKYVTSESNWSKINLLTALSILWYGIYQNKSNGELNNASNTEHRLYKLATQGDDYNSNTSSPCLVEYYEGKYFPAFACAVAGILAANINLSGGEDLTAGEYFYSDNEQTMAWFTVYTNKDLEQLLNASVDLWEAVDTIGWVNAWWPSSYNYDSGANNLSCTRTAI
jgi:RHS repeat-associated protein